MKPTKIYFQKKYFPAQYQSEDYGIELELGECDSIEEAFKQARETVFNEFKKANPQITWSENTYDCKVEKFVPQPNDFYVDFGAVKSIPRSESSAHEKDDINVPESEINKYWYEKKSTLEEQIRDCNTLDELHTFEMIANMNPKLKEIYSQRHAEIYE
jgi:hypothetical protein